MLHQKLFTKCNISTDQWCRYTEPDIETKKILTIDKRAHRRRVWHKIKIHSVSLKRWMDIIRFITIVWCCLYLYFHFTHTPYIFTYISLLKMFHFVSFVLCGIHVHLLPRVWLIRFYPRPTTKKRWNTLFHYTFRWKWTRKVAKEKRKPHKCLLLYCE